MHYVILIVSFQIICYYIPLFADTKEERNALMQHVYPKLAEFCREMHGLEFQVRLI